MTAVLTGMALFIISVFLRSACRLNNRNFGIDTWYFLLYADEFRKSKKLPVVTAYYFLDEDKQFYPPGFAILMSILSKKFLERWQWLINPVIDSLHLVVLFGLSYIVSSNLVISVFAALLYISSPILITQSSTLNSRIFGSFALSAIMLNLYLFSQSDNYIYFILAILCGVVLFYSHKMGMQQFLFLALGFSLITQKSFFMFALLAIWAFCFALGRGFYLNLLKSHIQIIKFWMRNLPFLGRHQIYHSPFYKDLRKAEEMKSVKGLRNCRPLYLLERVKLIAIFILAGYLYFFFPAPARGKFEFLFYWITLNYLTVIVTSFMPGFKYLGEGYKYLIYGIFPISFLLSFYSITMLGAPLSVVLLGIILLINLSVSAYIIKVLPENFLAQTEGSLFKIFDRLKALDKDGVLCFPFAKADSVAYFTRKKVLFGGHSLGLEKLDEFWPVLKRRTEYFIDKYDINYILSDDRYVDLRDLNLRFAYKLLDREENYRLIEVKR